VRLLAKGLVKGRGRDPSDTKDRPCVDSSLGISFIRQPQCVAVDHFLDFSWQWAGVDPRGTNEGGNEDREGKSGASHGDFWVKAVWSDGVME
jgi:hypothetical protein